MEKVKVKVEVEVEVKYQKIIKKKNA